MDSTDQGPPSGYITGSRQFTDVVDAARDEWLRVPEIPDRFKVSARTAWRAIADGHLRCYRPAGTRVVLVRATDVVAWLAGGRASEASG